MDIFYRVMNSRNSQDSVPLWRLPVALIGAFLYMEVLFHLVQRYTFSATILLTVAFTLCGALLVWLVGSFFGRTGNRIVCLVALFFFSTLCCVQLCYYDFFRAYLTVSTLLLGGADAAGQFSGTIFQLIWSNLPMILLFYLPSVLFWVFSKYLIPQRKLLAVNRAVIGGMAFLVYACAIIGIWGGSRELYEPYDLYYFTDITEYNVDTFGLGTSLRLELQTLIFGSREIFSPFNEEEDPVFPVWTTTGITTGTTTGATTPPSQTTTSGNGDRTSSQDGTTGSSTSSGSTSDGGTTGTSVTEPPEITTPTTTERPIPTGENILPIDFATLYANETNSTVKDMHRYFGTQTPTSRNLYTGMFEGYNVIVLTAESFSYLAIDKDLTPTLYKLANSGFVFKEFYNPSWGVSTLDGEYVAMTGLLPKANVWSMFRAGTECSIMPLTLANQLNALDYGQSLAYHANTYTYYKRNQSFPTMGYFYKAYQKDNRDEHFLDIKQTWPQSDLETIEKTIDEYINQDKFSVYYMTVSGHASYDFSGNYIAYKNKKLVEHLPYSTAAKAYLACNIELDRAMELLLRRLEEAEKLDKTLIVLSPDHYPYALDDATINELAGHTVEKNFEIYKSTLIIWNSQMETVVVEKPCSSLDILPTVSNLLGLEYDSRLLMGTDILSDSEPLVMFLNRSFITDKVNYNGKTGKYTLRTAETVDSAYLKQYRSIVNDKFVYSAKIIENDYYAKVWPK